mmetsp:Transcript_7710/g.11021  ORF Transcript_7710/g.11021 Transcript_7710/m.11021 type:complete len:630 (-) Transcript_7710:48-1937(-)
MEKKNLLTKSGRLNRNERLRPKAPRKSCLPILLIGAFAFGLYTGNHKQTPHIFRSGVTLISSVFTPEKIDSSRSILNLLGSLYREQYLMKQNVIQEYGEYYGLIFDSAMMDRIFMMNNISRERLKRRMMIKILQSLSKENEPNKYEDDGNLREQDITFTWVTGGDSSAAGHGNLLEQSYTAVLEDTVKDVFASLGIKFIARNYAMGGYVSAPELALCMESIYGSDIDVLNWDFAKMDGTNHHRAALWGSRAGVHPSKPILFMMDDLSSKRFETFLSLESRGLSVALFDRRSYLQMKLFRAPDSKRDNVEIIPDALKYFMCNGATEGVEACDDLANFNMCAQKGGEECLRKKWPNNVVCKVPAHKMLHLPGWKDHQLIGRLLGMTLVTILSEAIVDLDWYQMNPSSDIYGQSYNELLNFFVERDKIDRFLFDKTHDSSGWDNYREDFDFSSILSKKIICHTSLASHSIENQRISQLINHEKMFHPGQSSDHSLYLSNKLNHQKCELNEKNVYVVKNEDGWMDAKFELGFQGNQARNEGFSCLVVTCFSSCANENCSIQKDGLDAIKLLQGNIKIEINGSRVTDSYEIEGCHILKRDTTRLWNFNTHPNIKFRVDEKNGKMEITSLLLIRN